MLGLFVVMKLPQICLNASAMSGPTFAGVGPKSVNGENSSGSWNLHDAVQKHIAAGETRLDHLHAATSIP